MMSIFEYVPLLLVMFAVWRLSIKLKATDKYASVLAEAFLHSRKRNEKRGRDIEALKKAIKGTDGRVYIKAKIAEKTADRAFNMASSANLGVVALQKALAVPRLMTKQQGLQNKFAKNEVDKLFNGEGTFDWLRPILSDEELEIIDKAEELKERQMNGEHKI